MKQTHLKTLSARIKELHELLVFRKIDLEQFFHLTLDANKQSETMVTLAHFVPCDKNGVPLEKLPQHIYLDNKTQTDKYHEWHEAQKSVVFEGWEVSGVFNDGLDFFIQKDNYIISFLKIGVTNQTIGKLIIDEDFPQQTHIRIQSLADLAAATTENPLKLK